MKVVAIIQARMGSTRLPRKAMLDIEGKPMLWHVVERIKRVQNIDEVVVATTTEDEDRFIVDYCAEENINCFRGSSEDVLDRYYKAALDYKADVVVRITSDCPLIDSGLVDRLVEAYLAEKEQYVGASTIINRTFPRGLDCELVNFRTLERLWKDVAEIKYREHVTLYMYKHPEGFDIKSVELDKDFSDHRWTVDEQEDLDFIREVYKSLYVEKENFDFKDVLSLLNDNPDLSDINRHIQQKVY